MADEVLVWGECWFLWKGFDNHLAKESKPYPRLHTLLCALLYVRSCAGWRSSWHGCCPAIFLPGKNRECQLKMGLRSMKESGNSQTEAVSLLPCFLSQLYVPSIPGMPDTSNITPEQYGMDGEDITITTKDGVKIHAWLLKLKQWTEEELRSRPVILFFQVKGMQKKLFHR